MTNFLKFLCIVLAVVLVFGAAKFLDGSDLFRPAGPEAPAQTAASLPEQTDAPVPSEAETQPEETEPAETEPPALREFTLSLVGNCVLGSTTKAGYQENGIVKTVGEDYGYPFRNVVSFFEEDDFTFLNLEAPLVDGNAYSTRRQLLGGPTAFINILSGSSVDAVSLANEHIHDHGDAGYASTTSLLDEAGIHYSEQDKATLFTTEKGLTIGIYSVLCVGQTPDTAAVTAELSALREQADLVIFAPHWGTVGNYAPTDSQKTLAHAAIDAGADIVCGTHPSVLQPMEAYGDGLIFYSLGTFCTGATTQPEDLDSAIVQLHITLAEDGTVMMEEPTVIPVCISTDIWLNQYQPTPYAESDPGYASTLSKLGGTYPLSSPLP